MIDEAEDVGRKSSVRIFNGHMSFENAEFDVKHKYEGQVVLRGDNVKTIPGLTKY